MHTAIPPIYLPTLVDVTLLSTLLDQQAPITVIDVRTPAEFETAHIPGSHNIPLDNMPDHRAALIAALREPTVIVCRSGNRARQAEQLLRDVELQHLHVLDGGVIAWEAANQPLQRGRARWSLERQVRGVAGALMLAGIAGGLAWRPLLGIAGGVGAGLTLSALTDSCAMGMVLSKLPYNRGVVGCDIPTTLQSLAATSQKQGL